MKSIRRLKNQDTFSGFKNKKGNLIDIIFIIIVLFIIGLAMFFIKYSFDEINSDLATDPDLSTQAQNTLTQGNSNFTNWADYTVGFIFFGLIIVILVTSYFVDVHPVFFVVSLIGFTYLCYGGAELSNSFQETVGDTDFVSIQADLPITMFIVENLIMLLIVTFVLASIITYGKLSNSGGGFQ